MRKRPRKYIVDPQMRIWIAVAITRPPSELCSILLSVALTRPAVKIRQPAIGRFLSSVRGSYLRERKWARAPLRNSTRFERDEEPISEGGLWINGRRDGLDWCDVLTRSGVAYGEVSRMAVAERRAEQAHAAAGSAAEDAVQAGDYDDPTAVLSGTWGPNQSARATVFSRNPTDDYFQEVELRLRSSITPHVCTGYEVFWRCSPAESRHSPGFRPRLAGAAHRLPRAPVVPFARIWTY